MGHAIGLWDSHEMIDEKMSFLAPVASCNIPATMPLSSKKNNNNTFLHFPRKDPDTATMRDP